MELPVELLDMVLQHLSKPEVKQLRQTCKRLAIASIPSLFDSVFISRDSLDREYSALALTQFKTSIKTVIVCPLKYPKLDLNKYGQMVTCMRRCRSLPNQPGFFEHIQMGYKAYCNAQERAGHPSSRRTIEALFQRIISEAPSIHRVVITHRHRFNEMTDLELAKYCWSKSCGVPREMHALFRLTPLQSLRNSGSPDIARAMFSIAPAGVHKIKELVMEPTDSSDGFFKIPIKRFRDPSCLNPQNSDLMANLRKLRLDIDEVCQGVDQHMEVLVNFLRQANKLECLALCFRGSCREDLFRLALSGFSFPKLRVLVLEGLGISGDEILSTVAKTPGLKHLVLERCWLNGYRCYEFLDRIKAFGTLTELHICRCYQDLGRPSWHRDDWHYYRNFDKDLQNFLLHDGPNPLGVDKLAEYEAEAADSPTMTPLPSFAQLYGQEYF